jgi:pyruvate formate lyase activating enzyme
MTRRSFLVRSAAAVATLAVTAPLPSYCRSDAARARYCESLPSGEVHCLLCPKGCVIAKGRRGACGVRENRNGSLFTLVYGHPCAIHLDPIEKKPFFHVLPGTLSFSLATVGCNLDCKFCQNWQISQSSPEDVTTRYYSADEIVERALTTSARSIAYTYGEPVVFSEYVQAIAESGARAGLASVVVSNGFINRAPLTDLCRLVDAIKIDLKAFTEDYYREICGAKLKPVLDSIAQIRESGVWLELVYLMVPTLNDDPQEIRNMARWLRTEIGTDVPIHFSRFYPQYQLANLPPTPVSSLERAHEICREEGLEYVYIGNVPGHVTESTHCPSCSKIVISRKGYRIGAIEMTEGRCRFCGHSIPGIWEET